MWHYMAVVRDGSLTWVTHYGIQVRIRIYHTCKHVHLRIHAYTCMYMHMHAQWHVDDDCDAWNMLADMGHTLWHSSTYLHNICTYKHIHAYTLECSIDASVYQKQDVDNVVSHHVHNKACCIVAIHRYTMVKLFATLWLLLVFTVIVQQDDDLALQYLASVYWAFTTMTTVGKQSEQAKRI